MAVNFPPNPSIGDTVTDPATGTVWTWDGYKWTFTPGSGGGGGTVDPADLISAEVDNALVLGTDDLLYVPTPGPVVGVTDGSNAAPGMVGEYMESVFPSTAPVAVDWGRPFVATTLNLPAGDWDVWGTVVAMNLNAGDVAASFAWIQTTPPEITDWPSFGPQGVAMYGNATWIDSQIPSQIMNTSPIRVNVAAATTVYLVTWIGGSAANSPYSCAVSLAARRAR